MTLFGLHGRNVQSTDDTFLSILSRFQLPSMAINRQSFYSVFIKQKMNREKSLAGFVPISGISCRDHRQVVHHKALPKTLREKQCISCASGGY